MANYDWFMVDQLGMTMTKNWRHIFGCVIFTMLFLITIIIALATVFTEPIQIYEDTLISTLGIGMSIFGLAITLIPFRRVEKWA